MTAAFFAVDLETTGFSPTTDEIIQIAFAVLDEDARVLEEGACCVLPTKPVPRVAAAVNGYTPELWAARGAVPIEDFRWGLQQLWEEHALDRIPVLGQSVAFDVRFLAAECEACPDYAQAFARALHPHDFRDTCAIAKELDARWGIKAPTYRLYELTQRYDVKFDNAHDAVADLTATIEVYRRLMEYKTTGERPPPPVKKSFIERKHGVWVFREGRWRGTSIDKADRGYLLWALAEVDLQDGERETLKAALSRR